MLLAAHGISTTLHSTSGAPSSMAVSSTTHLPATMQECRTRGWDSVDIVLVTGDAYVDHPSFGVAIIGRLLESHGYRVAILSQPDHNGPADFQRFGRPRLFFGITAGNLDSIVANYSGSGKVRDHDAYSADGNPWRPGEQSRANRRRPDRATILYANLARAAYKNVPVILGGIEASLRRFVHFDFKQNRLRGSVLTDSKADLLVYGMGERAILAVAQRCLEGGDLANIEGCCERLSDQQFVEWQKTWHGGKVTYLPSRQEIGKEPARFMEAELAIDRHCRHNSPAPLVQRQQSGWVIQHQASSPLSREDLDALYSLPFTRTPHPRAGDIPAYRMIRHSATIVRGCSGNCSFCAITRHQGPVVQSRSQHSIVEEARAISEMEDFTGTITDLGGPTANLFATSCNKGGCQKHDCLYPRVCDYLVVDEDAMLDLLQSVAALDGVKHVFISSGVRMELLLQTPRLLRKLLEHHTPGSLKIAPEHTEQQILTLMHKESHHILEDFVKECQKMANSNKKEIQRKLHLTPYVIIGHPGSCEKSAHALVAKMQRLGLTVRQFQDFTPTPGTLSTAMLVSGTDSRGRTVSVPSTAQKKRQRQILEQALHKRKSAGKQQRTRKKF